MKKQILFLTLILGLLISSCNSTTEKTKVLMDPLPSWNEGDTKTKILNFVADVIDENNSKFVPIIDRIAAFDNDGTLWTERPLPPQVYFILENAKSKKMNVDYKHLSKKKVVELAIETQTGMSENRYRSSVLEWYNSAKHPQKSRLFKDLKFKPMTELIQFLKDNDFIVFIVSGGSRDFMRAFVVEQYGIPEYRTVGSTFKIKWNDSLNVIERNPKIELINDHFGKPVGIYNYIGKKPIFIAGNSDGDYYMMKYAANGSNPFLNILITHTDSIREYEYNNKIGIDKETQALERCHRDENWVEVNMKKDWKIIY